MKKPSRPKPKPSKPAAGKAAPGKSARKSRPVKSAKAAPAKAAPAKNAPDKSAAALIDARIAELADWRGETLAQVARPDQGSVPRSDRGMEMARRAGVVARRHHLHRRDLQGRREDDLRQGRLAARTRRGLFNASLDGNIRRAIDIHEGEAIDAAAFKALVRAAAALNTASRAKSPANAEPRFDRVERAHALAFVSARGGRDPSRCGFSMHDLLAKPVSTLRIMRFSKHDLFAKPVSTFADHAVFRSMIFS